MSDSISIRCLFFSSNFSICCLVPQPGCRDLRGKLSLVISVEYCVCCVSLCGHTVCVVYPSCGGHCVSLSPVCVPPSPHFSPRPPRTSLYSNQTSTSASAATQVHRLGSKLDRNCGKKAEKQMRLLNLFSSAAA